jgi:hypothetical protein
MSDVPLAYTISGWPAYYPWAEEELKAMVNSHHVNYLEAYNMHGWLIEPRSYQKYLRGALVQIHFMLTHWSIGGKPPKPSCDTFAADIYSIRVLVPPVSYGQLVTPRKRKFLKTDPLTPDISPKGFRVFTSSSTDTRS